MILKILIIIVLLTNSAFAQNAVKLNAGETAEFSGILVNEDKMKELIKSDKLVPLLETKLDLQKDLVTFHHEDAMLQRKKLSEAKFGAFWTNTGYFILGAVLTAVTFKINDKIGDI